MPSTILTKKLWIAKPKLKKKHNFYKSCYSQVVEKDRFELPNQKELSYSQPRLATSLPPHWCRLEELNPQPTDYKSVALPIELSRQKNGGG